MESQAKLLAAIGSAKYSTLEVEENRWLEKRAKMLQWSDQQRCYQLKSHLSKLIDGVLTLLGQLQHSRRGLNP